MTLVITNCTNRKRKPIPHALHMSDLAAAPLPTLAAAWAERLEAAPERFPATSIYGGRAFQEAVTVATATKARLLVISAGLGLIDASTDAPPYACTVLVGAADSVAGKVTGPYGAAHWWTALRAVSPFARPLAEFVAGEDGPILVALSDAYLALIADELLALPPAKLDTVRIFTRTPSARVAPGLRHLIMPYDDRLDGPDSDIPGTRSDFAGRALRHFVALGSAGTAVQDAAAVETALAAWRLPARHDRARHDDAALLDLMRMHWLRAGGSSSKLLRIFRDDLGIACEQSRFAGLARQIRGEQA
ncbi:MULTISPECIES: hypothetical protein [unclassified Sphingomonas]|uniref:hypothetical protein n=1 Tax=unclassified Sphingomonas TaxID=196159 RepID=UPI000A7DA541|nr:MULTISPECIES: hypothetical protein [unclassified Sphingomonas]